MAAAAVDAGVLATLGRILGHEVQMAPDGFPTVAPAKLKMLAQVPHPFPYQGSKRALAHAIVCFLPEDTETLIEPFAGSAAISIAARFANLARKSVIADLNAPLMGLWQRIIDDPIGLADDYERMWIDSEADPKAYFLAQRAVFNQSKEPAVLLYLLNRIVKGAVRYSQNGDFNQSADNRRRGAKPVTVRQRLIDVSATMLGTEVHAVSYESLLVNARELDVVYMDPPYQGVTDVADHRYCAGLRRLDYEVALRDANANGVSYMVSYDAVREDNKYGEPLSSDLGLTHLHLSAGQSAQATLSGEREETLESLYLSPALVRRLESKSSNSLFG
ncbi:MAG: DNA adenine methylase [Actinomycetes bacterium]